MFTPEEGSADKDSPCFLGNLVSVFDKTEIKSFLSGTGRNHLSSWLLIVWICDGLGGIGRCSANGRASQSNFGLPRGGHHNFRIRVSLRNWYQSNLMQGFHGAGKHTSKFKKQNSGIWALGFIAVVSDCVLRGLSCLHSSHSASGLTIQDYRFAYC